MSIRLRIVAILISLVRDTFDTVIRSDRIRAIKTDLSYIIGIISSTLPIATVSRFPRI
jgi:hypothetical protein